MRRQAGRDGLDPPAIRLAVFDLDGTLTRPGTSVLRHLGRQLGFAAQAEHLAAGYADGSLTNAQVSRDAAALLRGRGRADLQRALATLPMVDGIAETIALLDRLGVCCAISTITFDFAAQYVAGRFGFARVSATRLEWSVDLIATGNVAAVLEAQDKCGFLRDLCAELGLSSAQVLFVGDARSDIPAIEMAGWSVGFNPSPEVEDLASTSVHHSTDLRDVLPGLHDVLGGPGRRRDAMRSTPHGAPRWPGRVIPPRACAGCSRRGRWRCPRR
jgi:phosphoserine phosphatase